MKHFLLLLLVFLASQYAVFAYDNNTEQHTVSKGETLYKIALMHKISVDDLKSLNPQIVGNNIHVGDVLNIPAVKPTIEAAQEQETPTIEAANVVIKKDELVVLKPKAKPTTATLDTPTQEVLVADTKPITKGTPQTKPFPTDSIKNGSITDTIPLEKLKPVKHVVVSGENLVSIARLYNQTLNNLKSWNKLNSFDIKPAQELIIAWILPLGEAVNAKPKPSKPRLDDYPGQYMTMSTDSTGMYKSGKGTGVATFFDDGGGSNMYCLHRTAPVQSVVRITNPVNNRSVYLKVIGTLPNTIQNEDVEVNITSSAAQKLNMRDERTIVKWRWYTPKK